MIKELEPVSSTNKLKFRASKGNTASVRPKLTVTYLDDGSTTPPPTEIPVTAMTLKKYFYIKDHPSTGLWRELSRTLRVGLGSTRAVVGEEGAVTESYDYYPFGLQMPGRIFVQGSANTKNLFVGEEWDEETNSYYLGQRSLWSALGRMFTPDRFADKYPSQSPYVYAANNPVLFIDVNGDSIIINDELKDNEALASYLNTKEGRKQIARFAYEGQTITVAGQEFTFENAGQYSTQNVNFVGVGKKDAGTTPVNSISGRGFIDTQNGVQSYEIRLSETKNLGDQMDNVFHEVQHSSMFATGKFTGQLSQYIKDIHHGNMMLPTYWAPHERFISQANRQFNTSINPNDVHGFLYNQIQNTNVAKKVVEILNRYNKKR